MIPRSFFQGDPLTCAKGLIGGELVWNGSSGVIVETEAYSVVDDEACHAFLRPTARQFVADHPAGTAYVYLNYGVHWLVNVLVRGGAEDGFVLIRALEPALGIDAMKLRRGREDLRALCSGPGKLTQALGIAGSDHGRDLCAGPSVGFRAAEAKPEIVADLRVGISKAAHLPWRFLLRDSPFVSVRAGAVRAVQSRGRSKT